VLTTGSTVWSRAIVNAVRAAAPPKRCGRRQTTTQAGGASMYPFALAQGVDGSSAGAARAPIRLAPRVRALLEDRMYQVEREGPDTGRKLSKWSLTP